MSEKLTTALLPDQCIECLCFRNSKRLSSLPAETEPKRNNPFQYDATLLVFRKDGNPGARRHANNVNYTLDKTNWVFHRTKLN